MCHIGYVEGSIELGQYKLALEPSQASVPAASVPGPSVPGPSVPKASVPDASVPAASVPDASVPAASVPKASVPGASVPHASVPDVGAFLGRPVRNNFVENFGSRSWILDPSLPPTPPSISTFK